jgi:hypothetical protein
MNIAYISTPFKISSLAFQILKVPLATIQRVDEKLDPDGNRGFRHEKYEFTSGIPYLSG